MSLTYRNFPSIRKFSKFTIKYPGTTECIHHILSPFWIKIIFPCFYLKQFNITVLCCNASQQTTVFIWRFSLETFFYGFFLMLLGRAKNISIFFCSVFGQSLGNLAVTIIYWSNNWKYSDNVSNRSLTLFWLDFWLDAQWLGGVKIPHNRYSTSSRPWGKSLGTIINKLKWLRLDQKFSGLLHYFAYVSTISFHRKGFFWLNKTINLMPEVKSAMVRWRNISASSTFVATSYTIIARTFTLSVK